MKHIQLSVSVEDLRKREFRNRTRRAGKPTDRRSSRGGLRCGAGQVEHQHVVLGSRRIDGQAAEGRGAELGKWSINTSRSGIARVDGNAARVAGTRSPRRPSDQGKAATDSGERAFCRRPTAAATKLKRNLTVRREVNLV